MPHLRALLEARLSPLEVEVHAQALEELEDWVTVRVLLLKAR